MHFSLEETPQFAKQTRRGQTIGREKRQWRLLSLFSPLQWPCCRGDLEPFFFIPEICSREVSSLLGMTTKTAAAAAARDEQKGHNHLSFTLECHRGMDQHGRGRGGRRGRGRYAPRSPSSPPLRQPHPASETIRFESRNGQRRPRSTQPRRSFHYLSRRVLSSKSAFARLPPVFAVAVALVVVFLAAGDDSRGEIRGTRLVPLWRVGMEDLFPSLLLRRHVFPHLGDEGRDARTKSLLQVTDGHTPPAREIDTGDFVVDNTLEHALTFSRVRLVRHG